MISVFKDNNGMYKVDLSIGFSTRIYGGFTAEQGSKFKFRHLMNLTAEQAHSVAGLANVSYEMGYAQAKREIAEKLGLNRFL